MPVPKKTKKGSPRLDPYCRLLNRFYEPLVLLRALGKTRGVHSPGPQFDGSAQAIRRRFVDNLSFVCDHTKGGDTTTAIGIEECHDCYNFWVASNQNSIKIVEFLQEICGDLAQSSSAGAPSRPKSERELIHKCIRFAAKRVSKEGSLLSREIQKCVKFLDPAGQPPDLRLSRWLEDFEKEELREQSNIPLCERAYQLRHAPEMRELEARSRPVPGESSGSDRVAAFAGARHLLGRLGNHVRAPKKLMEDALALEDLLHEYSIRQIPVRKLIPRPIPDGLTKLASMLKRMLPANDILLPRYLSALTTLDQRLGIHDRILVEYNSPSFQPKVHAEVQVLEFFFKNELQFAGGDRFIGCSKPACYCCHLYFRCHPMAVVEPASHKNVYLNWSLPLLPLGNEDPDYKHQQQILIKMLELIRREALDQIDKQAVGLRVHPDSLTGITSIPSVAPIIRSRPMVPLHEQLSLLDIDSDDTRSIVANIGTEDFHHERSATDSSTSSDGGVELYVPRLVGSDFEDSD